VRPGQSVAAGERVGLIRFGSRVDVEIPSGTEIVVAVGDRVVGGVSVLGRRAARAVPARADRVEGRGRAFPI
jgi:phosphatidylserine decarboxylase